MYFWNIIAQIEYQNFLLITNNNKKNLFVKLYLFRLFGLLGIDTVIEKFDYSFEIKKKLL